MFVFRQQFISTLPGVSSILANHLRQATALVAKLKEADLIPPIHPFTLQNPLTNKFKILFIRSMKWYLIILNKMHCIAKASERDSIK